MSEKTLLVELKKEEKKIVEQKLAEARKVEETKKDKILSKKEDKKFANVFSSRTFKGASDTEIIAPDLEEIRKQKQKEVEKEEEITKLESKVSSVIEKPNYDLEETLTETEREKVFKIEREEKKVVKTKPSKLKAIVFSILFAIFGVWGVVNVTQIDSIGGKIAEVASEYYNINLPKYLQKLSSLDATNSSNMENLFETIPDEDLSPNEIQAKSNWFDRFCNFIAGLFGG